jgi:hypothetical protein
MSSIVRYSSGSTYTLVKQKVDTEIIQDVTTYHVPLTNINGGVRGGLGLSRITIAGQIEDRTACLWHDIVAVSLDSGTSYQTVYFSSVSCSEDGWSGIYPFTLELIASPLKEQAAVRYPTSASAWYWGLATSDAAHQHGNVGAPIELHYLSPLYYFPLAQDIQDFAGRGLTFTRALAKDHAGVSYAVNTPIFDHGLYIGSDTSQDVAKWTPAASTLKTITCQITHTQATGDATALTVWTATKNKLTIDITANTISWTDDTTTVTATFPTAHWSAGDAIDIIAIEDAAHAVTLVVRAAGEAWTEVHTGTLAAIEWPELTLGNLEGSIANLIEYPYVLVAAEWEALHYSLLPLACGTLYIANTQAEEIIKGTDGTLETLSGVDVTSNLAGSDVLMTSTPATITMSQGLSARWYVNVKRTDV